MNFMPLPSTLIPRHCFHRYLFLIHRLRSSGTVLFYQVICPVRSIFLPAVAFILVVPWRSRFAARWILLSNEKKAVSITRLATFLRKSGLFKAETKEVGA